jgi:hypothetical protein
MNSRWLFENRVRREPGACGPDARREERRDVEAHRKATSNEADGPQPPGSLRVGAAAAHLLRESASPMHCDIASSLSLRIWTTGAPNAACGIFEQPPGHEQNWWYEHLPDESDDKPVRPGTEPEPALEPDLKKSG